MTKLFIYGLQLPTVIGVYAEERLNPCTLHVDVELCLSIEQAVLSDQVADTVDYAVVANRLREWASHCQFHLLESLGHYLGQKLLQDFPVDAVKLCLKKSGVLPMAEAVGIELVFSRQNYPDF